MVKSVLETPMPLPKEAQPICRHIRGSHSFGVFYGENPLQYSVPIMLLEVSMLMVITRILRFILKPLRQPRVVSEILAGIIMGPSVLSRSKKFRSYFFPDNADFVLKNIGVLGFMYFLFISGVKTDLTVVKKAGRKHWCIALVSTLVPMICTLAVAIPLRKSMEKELAKPSSILGTSTLFALSTLPVLQLIIKELNLLSSEIGRLALLIAVISDIIGINCVIAFEAAKQEEGSSMAGLWYFISLIVFMISIFGGLRQAMLWIVKTTPEGKQVDQIYVIAILLGVVVAGFLTDMFGIAIANGPLWLGLAVPDGPPLGAVLVDKSETIVMDLLLPFSYTFVGMLTDVSSMSGNWSILQPIFLVAFIGCIAKVISTWLASRFCGMSLKESLAFSLLLNARGQVELLLFIHWMDFKMITIPYFTMLVLFTTAVTAVVIPLFSILYDPTRPYMVNKRRNIQHNPPNTELRIVALIHSEENVAGIINLLEVSNPTCNSPFSVFAVHLVELIARAVPIFIDHEKEGLDSEHTNLSSVHRALKHFEEVKREQIKLHCYTSITAKRSMYQDICGLALEKKASLIILPYHGEQLDNNLETEGVPSINCDVLAHAPCSVGIFVHRGSSNMHLLGTPSITSVYHFAVLFLGGADAREALVYADRMAGNLNVLVTVIRFLSNDSLGDNRMEKKLDDGLVTWFWVKHEGNNHVIYREVVVRNGEETLAAIRGMSSNNYDLWIVGRMHGINPVIIQGLADWSEHTELGLIGDYLFCSDLGSRASILVVQQQILRG
ncbi:cation/H(+) antiporter 24-like [Coffea arabica]|uniref:Cation/H(+) antiporter 24-like n=1 Tax=Coffea arabica TaxID=13443 RepID=A0A6P6WA85_COFAR|nr:cation/H(+) antiporter 24-like [Coffea arabica]